MSDDLRTRIAAVLNKSYPRGRYARYHEVIAGDLIRELGLREERGEYDGFFGRKTRHRYVTEWIPND